MDERIIGGSRQQQQEGMPVLGISLAVNRQAANDRS
jgi:hypothetical protein